MASPVEQDDRSTEAQVRHQPDRQEAEPGLAIHLAAEESGERPRRMEMEGRERRETMRLIVRHTNRVVGDEQRATPRRSRWWRPSSMPSPP